MAAGWSLNEPAQFDAAPGIATTTFDTSNLTAISYNFEHHGITALYPLQWVQTRAEPCFAPIKRMRGNFSCVEVAPNVEQLWKTQFAMLQPYIAAGSVVGIFLGDEHIYFGLNFSDTVMITALIKRDWPTAVIYQNEAPDVLMCGFNKLNETVLTDTDCLPSQLDLLSFDFYDTSFFGSTWESAQLAIERMVIPRLVNPSQQLVHVTTGYAQGPGVNITEFDHFCARNARQWLQYALSQPRLAGIFPFDWVSSGTVSAAARRPRCFRVCLTELRLATLARRSLASKTCLIVLPHSKPLAASSRRLGQAVRTSRRGEPPFQQARRPALRRLRSVK